MVALGAQRRAASRVRASSLDPAQMMEVMPDASTQPASPRSLSSRSMVGTRTSRVMPSCVMAACTSPTSNDSRVWNSEPAYRHSERAYRLRLAASGPGASVLSCCVSPKNSMDASKESCHERLDLVNALGTDVVPDVRPIRKGDSGRPSWSSVLAPARLGPVQLPAAQAAEWRRWRPAGPQCQP